MLLLQLFKDKLLLQLFKYSCYYSNLKLIYKSSLSLSYGNIHKNLLKLLLQLS